MLKREGDHRKLQCVCWTVIFILQMVTLCDFTAINSKVWTTLHVCDTRDFSGFGKCNFFKSLEVLFMLVVLLLCTCMFHTHWNRLMLILTMNNNALYWIIFGILSWLDTKLSKVMHDWMFANMPSSLIKKAEKGPQHDFLCTS